MIEKSCISPGCGGYPAFGFGLPSRRMAWACAAHRHLIWPEKAAVRHDRCSLQGTASVSPAGAVPAVSPPSPPQGVLI